MQKDQQRYNSIVRKEKFELTHKIEAVSKYLFNRKWNNDNADITDFRRFIF